MIFNVLLSLLTAHAAPANTTSVTIQKLDNVKHTALASLPSANEHVKIGDEYFVETPIGKCFVQVTDVMSDSFLVNTEQCGSDFLAAGKMMHPKEKVVIERQSVTQQQTIQPVPNDSVSIPLDFIDEEFYRNYLADRLSVTVAYLTGKSLEGTANLDATTSIGDFNTSNTIALGADYRIMTLPNNFSWSGGFEYNLPRSIGNYTLTTANGTQTQRFADDPTLEVFNLFTNARYQFNEKLYALIGLNYLFADVSDAPGEMSGDFGFHAGARWYAITNLFIDGQLNFYNLDYSLGGRTADFSMTELEVRAGYTF